MMKSIPSTRRLAGLALAGVFTLSSLLTAETEPIGPLVDDFNDPQQNSLGIDRLFMDDTSVGGKTQTQHQIKDGVLSATGEISPPRGQPGWASTVLLLNPQGQPQDMSAYVGVRLVIRVRSGNLAISANSSEITNFDYHAAPIIRQRDSNFHEVKIPFSAMKRAWSEQIPLNPKTLVSLSLVAVGMQPESFAFEIDEISFY